ncbi:MAG: ABC transporter permease [Caldilineaceae bacterium]|nr:ABC transporter permease [Caldilineaceae bacterium]HRJ40672.1 ABC transporter permease [Caldilineaceae bacterium]
MGLVQYIASRVMSYLIVLFVGITVTFFLPRFMPSDPVENYIYELQSQAGQSLGPDEIVALRETLSQIYGLEGNLFTQYLGYIERVVLHFDFGPSFSSFPTPVLEFIYRALPWTLGLLVVTTVIAWTLGNLIGLVAGYFNDSKAANTMEVVGVLIYPIPYYIVALVLILTLAYVWPIFPLTTTIRPGPLTLEKMRLILYNSFLPALTIVIASLGWNILSMKALAFANKEEGYVTFARLKGTPPRTIMTTYVFRNSILPQITGLSLSLGAIFNGALLTEILFSYPGMGLLMRSAAGAGDYNMMYGTITVSIFAVATAILVIDLLYPLFDPRIRYR